MIEQKPDHVVIIFNLICKNDDTHMPFDTILIFFRNFNSALLDISLKFDRSYKPTPSRVCKKPCTCVSTSHESQSSSSA